MKTAKYIVLSALLIGSFFACKKGATGPTGPTGNTGPQGASMVYTIDSTIVLASQWSTIGTPITYQFDEPYLDKPQSSLVEVYYSDSDNVRAKWTELPVYNVIKTGDEFYFSYTPYNIELMYNPITGSSPGHVYVRIIIIPQPE